MIKFRKKLQNKFNVDDLMLKCVKGYIEGITERLVIKSKHSKILPVNSGVPQGSTLEPFFFALLMINNIAIYADNNKIWRKITFEEDFILLNWDIDTRHIWADENVPNQHHFVRMTGVH